MRIGGGMREEVIGDCRLILGDCREVLPTLAGVDLLFTSPPYNLGNTTGGGFPGKKLGHYSENGGLRVRGGHGKWGGGALADGYSGYGDNLPFAEYVAWQKEILTLCWSALSDKGAIYYNHKTRVLNGEAVTPLVYNPGLPVRQIVIWARSGGINFSPAFYVPTHEWIVIFAKPDFRLKSKGASGAGDVWYIPQESNPSHPAPFPVALPERAIESTPRGLVADPFMGIASTGVACVNQGRSFIGVERDPGYFEIGLKRIEAAYRQPRLFAEPAVKPEQEPLL